MSISAVIPVKGRVNLLEKLLKSISEARKHTKEPVEVIVVDSSDQEDQGAIMEVCRRFNADYYYLQKGLSDARNYGIKIAKSNVIFFVDSDCEVDYEIFNEHLKLYSENDFGGCAGPTDFTGKETYLWRIIEKMPFLQPFRWPREKNFVPWAPCTNISFRKDILEEVNGFQSILPPKESGEDVDLGYRITSSGHRILCNKNAKVYHTRETWTKPLSLIGKTFRFGRGEYHLMKKYPENTYLDIPKNSLMFLALIVLCSFAALIRNNSFYAFIPFVWLPLILLIQSLIALKKHLKTIKGRDLGYYYFSLVFDFLFEIGTIIEAIKKGSFRYVFRRFIYIDNQLLGRWHWAVNKLWSFVISMFVFFIFFQLLR